MEKYQQLLIHSLDPNVPVPIKKADENKKGFIKKIGNLFASKKTKEMEKIEEQKRIEKENERPLTWASAGEGAYYCSIILRKFPNMPGNYL